MANDSFRLLLAFLNVVLVIWLMSFSYSTARKKGFAPLRWAFALLPIGTIVVLKLPSARSEGITQEESARRAASANKVGAWMCVINFVLPAVIVGGSVAWLAFSGNGADKSYYVTIAELGGMGDKAYRSHLRVEGFVVPGSIEANGTHVSFVLNEFESHSPKASTGRLLKVAYIGSEPPPDTFEGDAQALAEGSYGRDGVFHANALQAKCASKYASTKRNASAPGATPARP